MINKYKAPKKKRVKKPITEKDLLEKELTELWKAKSRKVYPMECLICGGKLSTWHHWIPKSRSLFLRYNIKNSIPICNVCHYKIHFSSKPTEVAEMVSVVEKKRGKEWCLWIKESRVYKG